MVKVMMNEFLTYKWESVYTQLLEGGGFFV
jgi:hypothetical protein